jgi:CBS domain containing-hemolysin-like protein
VGLKEGIEGHSWYPVCRGNLDDVIGVVSVARLISLSKDSDLILELKKIKNFIKLKLKMGNFLMSTIRQFITVQKK